MTQSWSHRDAARTEMNQALERLRRLSEEAMWDQEWVQKVVRTASALQAYVLAAATSLGECRKKTPYAPLKPVIDPQGNLQWCCEHDPEHCAR